MGAESTVYVLDSFAFLAYLNGEVGTAQVQAVLREAQKGECRVCLSLVNLGEIACIVERRRGLPAAHRVLGLIDSLPVDILPVTREVVLQAAHIKAHHPLAYADAFAVACTLQEGATLLTGDPEYRAVESLVPVAWLPR